MLLAFCARCLTCKRCILRTVSDLQTARQAADRTGNRVPETILPPARQSSDATKRGP